MPRGYFYLLTLIDQAFVNNIIISSPASSSTLWVVASLAFAVIFVAAVCYRHRSRSKVAEYSPSSSEEEEEINVVVVEYSGENNNNNSSSSNNYKNDNNNYNQQFTNRDENVSSSAVYDDL